MTASLKAMQTEFSNSLNLLFSLTPAYLVKLGSVSQSYSKNIVILERVRSFGDILVMWDTIWHLWRLLLGFGESDEPNSTMILHNTSLARLSRFDSMVWSMASESMLLGLLDLAACPQFFVPSGYCTVINCIFTFSTTNDFDWFYSVMTQF